MKRKRPSHLTFTGERLIPRLNKGAAFYYEHLARYIFTCQVTQGKRVIDLGCGTGYGSYLLATKGKAFRVHGVDKSQDTIEYAQDLYNKRNISFSLQDLEHFSKKADRFYDVAVSFEVIEHLEKQRVFLSTVKKILKKDGIFFVSTPNKYNYPSGNPYHVHELYPDEFKKLLLTYFKHVDFFYQNFEFSQTVRKPTKSSFEMEEIFSEEYQLLYAQKLHSRKNQYIIAVCSDKKLPQLFPIAINSFKIDNLDLLEGIIALENRGYQESKKIQELGEELENTQKILKTIQSAKFFRLWQTYCGIRDKLLRRSHD